MGISTEYVQKLRAESGMSWQDLADATGYPVSTVRDHVNGKVAKPNKQILIALVGAMGGDATRAQGISADMREDLAEVRKAQAKGDEEMRLTIETMRRIRGEMLEAQRESYEARIAQNNKTAEREIERLERLCAVRLRLCIVLISALVAIMLLIIGILVYDLTHLDRGWFQMFGENSVFQTGSAVLQNISGWFCRMFA